MLRKEFFFILIIALGHTLFAQKKNENYRLNIHKTSSAIRIDGLMSERAWSEAEVAKDFFMVLPMDTSRAKVMTEVKMIYDTENLYILATCFQNEGQKYMVESLKRDFVFGKNDNFIFFLDPFNNLTDGFTFGANASGAQWDGMLYDGGSADLNWDNKWKSAVKNYPDKWVFEAAIPFKTMRYKKGITTWGVNFSRLDITAAEKSSWAPVPRQFPTASLAFTGNLVWDEAPPDPGFNLSIIPYTLGGVTKDYDSKSPADFKKEFGADAKVAVTSSLNLDLTVNPDFSQVEVDKQVTNLDRYELFFPEKRQFFLENNDLFANFGYPNIRPFFSRRIGLGVPISFGARLSGSLDKNWRIGVMDMQTKSVDSIGLPKQNFTVVSLQRRLFKRSNFRCIFINKESLNYNPGQDTIHPQYSSYNSNLGFEYNLAPSNNIWTGKLMMMKSFSPGKLHGEFAHAANLQYKGRHWVLSWQHEIIGGNYNAEAGYVPRKDYIKINPKISRLFFPKSGPVLTHGPVFGTFFFFDKKFHQTDNEIYLDYFLNMRDQSVLDVLVAHDYVKLLRPFDPTNSGKDTLATGSEHHANFVTATFASRPQQLFTYNFSVRYGGYYADGKLFTLVSDLGYRFQPYVSILLSTSYNHITLPLPWARNDFWLIGPKIDVTMTNKLFFTTYLQYNNQQKNINLNTRFQWRYRPASDLFIVYTDNYYSSPFYVRNRAVVLKFTYWWRL